MASNPPAQSAPSDTPHAANTLRLRGGELTRLQQELDLQATGQHHQRGHFRWPFRSEAVRVDISHPGGATTSLQYACRNISGGGMSLMHSAYMHIGTPCVVHLPRPGHAPIAVPGKIVRCRHWRGTVHEVGVRFDAPIEIRELLELDPFEGRFTLEHVDPQRLSGSILHIDDSATDRRLIRHFLRESNITVTAAEDSATGLARAAEGFDIIIVDANMSGMNGMQVCEAMRAQGIQTPVIILSGDTRENVRQQARDSKANAFVGKPVDRVTLLRAIAEFLIMDSLGADGAGPIYSSLRPDDPEMSFVPDYVEELKNLAGRINESISAEKFPEARRLCFQIKGVAASLGFAPIGDAADAAIRCVDGGRSQPESVKMLRAVVFACLRARVRDTEPKARAAEAA